MDFPGGSVIKNLPAMQMTQVQSLGQKDPLEKGMAAHSSVLAWRIPWTEEPGGLYCPWGHKRVGHNSVAKQQQQLLASRAPSNASSTMKKIKRKEHYKLT